MNGDDRKSPKGAVKAGAAPLECHTAPARLAVLAGRLDPWEGDNTVQVSALMRGAVHG